MMEPEVLAESVVTTMDKEEFLILPHPEVLSYLQRKAGITTVGWVGCSV